MNPGQALAQAARRWPERPAITFEGRTASYAEVDRRSGELAAGLLSLGLARGDRVLLCMRNRPELLEAMYACFRAGLCVVPVQPRSTAPELRVHVADAAVAAVITDAEGAPRTVGLEPVPVIVAGAAPGALDLEEVRARGVGAPSPMVEVDRDDVAWLFSTSGTTGRPKAAMLTHGNLGFHVTGWLADVVPMDEHDVTLHAAPLSHGAGFHALAATARGARHVLLPPGPFDPAAVLEVLAAERVTCTWLVPTQIVLLTDAARAAGGVDLPHLRRVAYGGAPMAPAELEAAIEAFGPVFVQIYAQGETPMTATVLRPEDHVGPLLASAGVARTGTEVRVRGESGADVPPGEVGEVCVRGPSVMLGYWDRPEATAEALRDGWLRTGDLGRFDQHGHLFLLDRAKDLIITGGSNVYAVEVEAALAGVPGVREVAVVGVPDRVWGETVVAVVAAVAADLQALEDSLVSRCAEELAGYKRPRRYVFVDELPRNAYGKVLKRDLRADLAR